MTDSAAADMEGAEGLIGQALTASSRFYLPHFAKAQLLRAQHRYAEAIPEYETAVAGNPNWAQAYAHLGWSKFMTGSIEEATPAQEQAIRLSPRDPNIGNRYWQMGLVLLL
jgi:tetratricopeptide (TPR) repeat protein